MICNALFSDFYELTMAQGFWKKGNNSKTVFEMFFRSNPFKGGYSVFAGLEPLLETIKNFHFEKSDIYWLKSLGIFEKDFLEFIAGFKFSGNIWAMKEGSVVFPNEPLIRIEADAVEALLLEGLILNMINFQTLIATKTARIWQASKKGAIMEFGLRRAQGNDGAMSATRAAYIGGAFGTSNSLAAKELGIPALGTMAHSWIMSFKNEEDAFQSYADIYPDNSIFLIDTYDTLRSGIVNAIKVGKRLQEKGKNFGVRLDSGDIYYLSKDVRKRLDEAGCPNAKISVSNELTEEIVESLVQNNAPIDSWGVGTHMVTGGNEASLTGVYKMAARKNAGEAEWTPVMKFSDNPAKMTNPACKQVWRLYNADGSFKADVLTLEDEKIEEGIEQTFYHPANDYQNFTFTPAKVEALLEKRIENGKAVGKIPSLKEIKAYAEKQLDSLDYTSKRLLNPHIYKVSLSEKMRNLKQQLIKNKPVFPIH
ncbi:MULTISPECIES: nicotinate phosphoribosyltransferase [unclassified Treponema]|uniref:nicotinate phosphoribosyltransferase n=1 Tax=unclassified Treponema TaxID=2638727 RepID=UPI0020A44AEC|nr:MULTISPECIES: nicotinate phosphoribosyltransferase [unclassified Treponema]UTC66786.1 nicotinate phosphoribosyltransferase [Treponema sp. OMZ 789]UTC69519.1 nicotinate phosphoribosyltransferase [Treponema sp. OMZ 790]UTC72233.1 nicotinate phosphoribosyltransferase [Treponema sp. OMZ 791]